MLLSQQLWLLRCSIGRSLVKDTLLKWFLCQKLLPLPLKTRIPIFFGALGHTQSHQFAVLAEEYGGGQSASKLLRKSGFLACGIGLPVKELEEDLNGLRFGTPELVRWGMTAKHSTRLAGLITNALQGQTVKDEVSEWRKTFRKAPFYPLKFSILSSLLAAE